MKQIKLSGGKYGGYVVENGVATLYEKKKVFSSEGVPELIAIVDDKGEPVTYSVASVDHEGNETIIETEMVQEVYDYIVTESVKAVIAKNIIEVEGWTYDIDISVSKDSADFIGMKK
jgi:hypothetical protein